MKCFHFSGRDKNARPRTTKSISARSSSSASISMSTSADQDFRRSRSQFNSRDVSDLGAELTTKNSLDVFSRRKSDIREFTFSELKMATKNFSRSLMIGEGGFGGVYRGVIQISEDANKKMDIAVKQMSRRGQQGHKEWVTEVNVLGVVEHPNLVKLMGYCAEDDERGIQHLLVYEYMPNRSVQDHLSLRFQTALPWGTRMKIAQDAARGLAYLHEGMDFQIIFRDFKSSNILLDGQWNAKLSDFGLARLGPSDGFSHVSTAVAGTIGYAAPEYVQTGHLTSKNDVWSYGVFLFELITGRRPVDWNRPKKEQKLLEWVRPHLPDSKKFSMILDPTLEGKYNLRSARKLAAVANQCLARQAKARPKMSEVLEMVNKIVDVTEIGSPPVRPPMKSVASQDAPGISRRKHIKRMFIKPFIREE